MRSRRVLVPLAFMLALAAVSDSQTARRVTSPAAGMTSLQRATLLADSAAAQRRAPAPPADSAMAQPSAPILEPGTVAAAPMLHLWRSVHRAVTGAIVSRQLSMYRAAQPLEPGEIRTRVLDAVARPVQVARDTLDWDVPIEIMARDQAGTDQQVRPRVRMQGEGLTPGAGPGEYRGVVLVGLVSARDPNERITLEKPITIQLTGGARSYTPPTWQHEHTGIPYTDVTIVAQFPGPHPPAVDCVVMAGSESDTASVVLPVLDAPVTLSPSAVSLQGFGVEGATLVVTGPAPAAGGVSEVVVEAVSGTFATQHVSLGPGGTGEVKFRSGRPGVAEVQASAVRSGQSSKPVRVTTVLPIVFFLCALAGGLVGALLHEFGVTPKGEGPRTADGRGTRVMVGIGAGFVLALLYGLGINPLPVLVSGVAGEGIIFAVSIVGGLVGASALASKF